VIFAAWQPRGWELAGDSTFFQPRAELAGQCIENTDPLAASPFRPLSDLEILSRATYYSLEILSSGYPCARSAKSSTRRSAASITHAARPNMGAFHPMEQPRDPDELVTDLERQLAEAKSAARGARASGAVATTADARLAPPPRKVPTAFRLAELLPFRWWYVWTLFLLAVAPIALWIEQPIAFAAVAALSLAGIYGAQLWGARTRVGLLKWGRVVTVTDTELLSRATYYSGTTWYNVYLPVARGWTVTRDRWSGPNIKTEVRYTLDGHQDHLVVRGREYVDGVILADERNPARARCVTSFAYDLDRDKTGNWVGRLRPRLRIGMACWLLIVIGWLALAGFAATGFRTNFGSSSPPATVPRAGTLQVSGTGTTKTIPCNDGYLSVSGVTNTITVTGHCTSFSVSGNGNHVTIDSTDAVSTSGTGNIVTYHSGSPKIVNAGTSNTVQQG
jgi:hypothetical protein